MLSKFYLQIGRVEELGSGVLNVNKYLPQYAPGSAAQFLEGNPFITVIPLPPETRVKTREETTQKKERRPEAATAGIKAGKTKRKAGDGTTGIRGTTQKTPAATTQKPAETTTQKMLVLISSDSRITRKRLADQLGLTSDGVKYHLRRLRQAGKLRRIGPDKGGFWEIVEDNDL